MAGLAVGMEVHGPGGREDSSHGESFELGRDAAVGRMSFNVMTPKGGGT